MADAGASRSQGDLHEGVSRADTKDGIPFVPGAIWKDLFFSAFILLSIAVCAVYFGPFGPSGPPDPTIIQTAPRPDFFFLWLYAVLSFFRRRWKLRRC